MVPKISVLMPVLNGNKQHLLESIDSILNQTYSNFEFIIIDDGSNIETKDILSSLAAKDPRIIILTNETNIGVGLSLNKGLELAKGRYIARHDGDDNAKPHRFSTQVEFLENNPDIDLCCSSVNHIDMNGKYVGEYPCSTDSSILAAELLLNSRLCHPSLMIKTELLKMVGGYPVTKSAQDYLLYLKLLKSNIKFGGIDEHLVDYRINTESITRKNRTKQLSTAENASYDHVTDLLGYIDRNAFSNFWYFVATEGETAIKLSDFIAVKPILKLIRSDPHYKKAWLGTFRYVSRNSLDMRFSLATIISTVYFRYIA